MVSDKKALNSYDVSIAQMRPEDVPNLHELSVAVRWPHRPADWRHLIAIGQGFVARDELDRIVASIMWFPLDENFASIGMAISSPRLQKLGAGRWLAEHIGNQTGKRNLLLNATKDSLRLCLDSGFEVVQPVYHINGIVEASPAVTLPIDTLTANDYKAVTALDASALGAKRPHIMKSLLAVSQGTIIRKGGKVNGFALCRKFGRGWVIGPVVAETEEQAIALIQPLLKTHVGEFVRFDTTLEQGMLRQYLLESGLKLHETVTRMTRGTIPESQGSAKMIALASQALN